MTSLILRTATRFLITVLLLISLFFLFRGHNEPGGGFIGGLVCAAAFSLYALAFGAAETRRALWIPPPVLIGIGLCISLLSALASAGRGQPFMTAAWAEFTLGGVDKLALGTPLLFDVGVFVVVVGMTLTVVLSLEEED